MPNDIKIAVGLKDGTNADAVGKKVGKDIADGVGKGAAQASKSVDTASKQIRSSMDRAGSSSKSAGKDIATGIDAGADKAAKSVDSASKKIKSDLDKLGEAGKGAGSELSAGLSEGLSNFGGAGGSLVGGLVDQIKSGGKAGMLGAGLIVGGLLMSGIQSAVEQGKVGALVASQTGQVGDAAGRMGSIAGHLFSNSFGASVEDAGKALTAVFQNNLIDTSASDAAISDLAGKVITVAGTVEEETGRVARSARTMVVNGVAGNVSEALDIIQRGTEKGLNTAGDLLDTIDEYSIQFSRVGLSGQEAMGLISQALQGGARDADVAADAIKEFAIRAQDGSDTTARGFEAIGLNADEMGNKIASGGKNAHEALRATLNALQGMPPGIERSTAAVDLFGTKAEDMGDALYSMDLDDAVDEFGNVEGAVTDAERSLSDSVPVWEQWGKNATQVMTDVGSALTSLRGAFDNVADGMSGVDGGMQAIRDGMAEGTDATEGNADAQGKEAEAVEYTTGTIKTQVETLDEWIAKKQEAAGIVLDARDAERNYQEAVDETTAALEKNGATHDDNTEKGRDNNDQLDKLAKTALDVAEAMNKDGRSVSDVNKKMADARNKFIASAQAMGYSKSEAVALANKLRLIPKQVSIAVLYRDAAARANLAAFKRALDNIPRTITVSTYVRGANVTPGSGGHQFVQAAGGNTPHSTAQEGGSRGGSTLINEAGPELVQLPSGSRVMTAGATRAMAEAGLLNLDGMIPSQTAATGGARGKGPTGEAYIRSLKGWVNVGGGQHSQGFIDTMLRRGWRGRTDDKSDRLYSPQYQRAHPGPYRMAGAIGRPDRNADATGFTQRATAVTGTAERPEVGLHISGDADQAIGAMLNRLHRDGVIRFTVRS